MRRERGGRVGDHGLQSADALAAYLRHAPRARHQRLPGASLHLAESRVAGGVLSRGGDATERAPRAPLDDLLGGILAPEPSREPRGSLERDGSLLRWVLALHVVHGALQTEGHEVKRRPRLQPRVLRHSRHELEIHALQPRVLTAGRALLHDGVHEDADRDVSVVLERELELGGDEVAHRIVPHVLDEHEHDRLVHDGGEGVGGGDERVEELEHARERVDLRPGVGRPRRLLQAVDHLPALLAFDLNFIRKRRPQRGEQREANLSQVLRPLRALQRGEEHGPGGALLDHGLPWAGPARQHRRHEDVERVHVNLWIFNRVRRRAEDA